jgi:transcriptional regulator with XRE-family HTH domain
MSIFSRRLKAARRLRNLTQSQLAQKARLQQVVISFFETGRRSPSFGNLKRLADGLNVTTDYLMGRSDSAERFGRTACQFLQGMDRLSAQDFKVLLRIAENLAHRKS